MNFNLHWFRILLIPSLLGIALLSSGEGTKQLMPDSINSKNCKILIANGNVGGNMRDPFALYNGDTNYRLHIKIKDCTKEKIFYGVGASGAGAVTWRIHKPDGTVAWSGNTPTAIGQQGFIRWFSQAYAGPTKIAPGGYNALDFSPTVNGDYFLTFQVSNANSRTYEKFDITVIDTTTNAAIPGRVHCKAWQLNTNDPSSHGYFGYLYVYSKDSLVTKFDPNGMLGMWFTISCNESGCYPIGPGMPASLARKSTEGWHNYPQYEIFLNDPDSLIYPSGVFGQIVVPPPPTPIVTTISNCNNGTILFIFSVIGVGSVTIDLQLSTLGPPYVDRQLVQTVLNGIDTITWDGMDGATPANVVPNGSQFPFTLTFINGLTHLPLWDVEENPNGFKVNLQRPLGSADPLFYWDDTGLNPANGPLPVPSSNFTGCNSSTSVCHSWSGAQFPGDNRTINTWWYVSNTSTVPVMVQKKQKPGNLGSISGPLQICQGQNTQFTVTADPNTSQYVWTYPGGTDTTWAPVLVHYFPLNTPPGPGQVTVHGINPLCGAGPVSTLNIIIEPVPDITNSLADSICSGTFTAFPLTSSPPGATFSWTSPAPVCSGNILVCPPGSSSTSQINDLLTVTDLNSGTVMYIVTPILGTCTGATKDIIITVSPLPDVIINSTTPSICSGQTTSILLSSTVPGTILSWTATGSSPNLSGFALSGAGNIIQTITNSGFTAETVTFSIIPSANGCIPANPTPYVVTVYPIPDLFINSTTPSICSGQSTNIQLSSSVTGATFNWTASASSPNLSGFPPGGSGNIIFNITNSGMTTEKVIFAITPTANGCSPATPVNDTVTVYPIPVPSLSGPAAVCQGLTGTYSTDPSMSNYTWSATAGGTILGGNGTYTITVQWNSTGAQTVNVNYIDGNGCTANTPSIYAVTVNPLPVPTISGNNSPCNNTNHIYTTESGMNGYNWTVPAGGTITAGAGTNAITVHWTVAGNHTVSVNYSNGNGCTAVTPTVYNVTVHALPVPSVSGPATMCLNNTGTYITEPGMTNYQWTITGGSITSGSGTNTIQANWTATGLQVLTVTYTDGNGCDPAAPTGYNVLINTLPVPTITGVAIICAGNSTVYTTEAGMSTYTWGVSPGGAIIAGSGTNAITVLWNTAGAQTVSVNYVVGTGCTAPLPTVKNITVNPIPTPVITGTNPLCEFSTQVYSTPGFAGHTYNWSVTGGAIQSGQGTAQIQVLWGAAGNGTITLTETIVATSCFASAPAFAVSITPYPLAAGPVTGSNSVCEASNNVIYSVPAILYATSYNWTYSGSGATITNNGSTVSVNFAAGATSGILTVKGVNNCGPGPSSNLAITINPLPVVTFTSCNDPVTTTNAQPFKLKGGIPLGGVYAGPGVSAGVFNPGLSGPGNHVITYTYTNTWGCISNNTHPIIVISSPGFACGNDLTDVRDNQQYLTVHIGVQCWMATNLNYGTAIASSSVQRDNCLPEKYCFNDTPANCTGKGGLYQWDELMQFTDASASQGLCPPGWHVPTVNDWNILFAGFNGNGFAGSPLKNTGFSGFDVFLWGARFENSTWSYNNFATFFWTSAMDGPDKAWAHGLNTIDPSVSKYPNSRSNAYFVRCIKD